MTHETLCRAGQAHVVCQLGQTCSPGFFDTACYRFYQLRLVNRLRPYGVSLHAYSLQADRILLLLTASTPTAVAELLRSLNDSYSDYFALRFRRRIRVWRDRFRLTAVPTDALVLDCQKLIEQRESYSAECGWHPWTSYCANALGLGAHFLTPHRAYEAFMRADAAHARYRAFIAAPFNPAYHAYLQSCIYQGRPLLGTRRARRLRSNESTTHVQGHRAGAGEACFLRLPRQVPR